MRKLLLLLSAAAAAAAIYGLFLRPGARGAGASGPNVVAGTVEAREVDVANEVEGRIVAIHVEEGQAVRRGDPLVSLDPEAAKLRIERLASRLEAAQAELADLRSLPRPEDVAVAESRAAEAELADEKARSDLDRARKLREKGAIPDEDVIEREAAARLAAQRLETARRELAAARAGARPSQVELDRSRAGAPARPPRGGEPAVNVRVWYNPGLESEPVLLLGAMLFNLMWFMRYPAGAVILEKERGTIVALRATPVGALDLWAGIAAVHGLVSLWGCLVQIAVGLYALGVPFRGDPWLLLGGLLLFALIHVNLGFVLSALVSRRAQRTLLVLVIVFVAMAFTGFLLPVSCLPAWGRTLGEALPLKHGIVFLRGVFLKGIGVEALAGEVRFLGGAAAATTVVALLSLRAVLRSPAGGG